MLVERQVILEKIYGEDLFYEFWANKSQDFGDWQGMVISRNGVPSQISAQSARKLFNGSIFGALTNANRNSIEIWKLAVKNDQKSINFLTTQFEITPNQLSMILRWLSGSFQHDWVVPYLQRTFQIERMADL